MLRNHVFTVLLLLVYISSSLPAQDAQRDSVLKKIAASRPDTNKINLLLDLSRDINRSSPTEALDYANQAIKLSEELGFIKGLAIAHKNAGMANYFLGSYAEAINHWDASSAGFEAIGDKAGVANILSNMGAVYNNFGEDTKALEFYFKAQKAAGEIGDSLRVATTMINIGLVYLKKEATLNKALDIYLAALPIAEASRDHDAIGTAAINLGEVYFKLGDDSTALAYYLKSMKAFENTGSGNFPATLTNIGQVYAHRGDFRTALEYQKRAYDISASQNARPNMLMVLLGLADTYRQKGDIRAAIATFEDAKSLASDLGSSFELRDAYQGLAESFAEISDYYKAYTYQKLLTVVKDTINQNSNQNVIVRQQLSFDLDKKQAELEVQELEVQKQRVVKNAFLAGLLLILITAFIIFRNYLNKVRTNKILDKQNAQIENLLLNILPKTVAMELRENGKASPRDYSSVSVLFTDFKGFTRIAEGMSPNDLVSELNEFFHAFDDIVERHNLEKIKTIGDAYMCAGGIPIENSTHPADAVEAGFEIQRFISLRNQERLALGKEPWELRIGIHTGPVVAGVVGRKKYAYDIWGSTVNIASRLESNGEAGKVNISETTYDLISNRYKCHYRGKISAKNLGDIDMYFVENKILLN